jgi:hypothetical protein
MTGCHAPDFLRFFIFCTPFEISATQSPRFSPENSRFTKAFFEKEYIFSKALHFLQLNNSDTGDDI